MHLLSHHQNKEMLAGEVYGIMLHFHVCGETNKAYGLGPTDIQLVGKRLEPVGNSKVSGSRKEDKEAKTGALTGCIH
jgi:hypothetical protein